MATFSETEGWFSILGAGMAGLRLLKEFGIRTAELEYFIQNFDKTEMKISAFAPSPLIDQYETLFNQAKERLKEGIEQIKEPKVTDKTVDNVLKDAKELYNLLGEVHRTIASGLVLA
jgi:hypothetical protein